MISNKTEVLFQGIWGEINRIDPNPMKCPDDIKIYSKILSEQKLFQFLNSLDKNYEHIKRELLRLEPLPSTEAAYATVRKEAAHQTILGATDLDTQGIASGLSAAATEIEGIGLATKGYRRPEGRKFGSTTKEDKSHLQCDNCVMNKHTREQCFELVGYPDWWTDGHKTKTKTQGQKKGKIPIAGNTTDWKSTGFGGVATMGSQEYQDGRDNWA